jgi:hypothetical protein
MLGMLESMSRINADDRPVLERLRGVVDGLLAC